MESFNTGSVIGADAAAEQERHGAVIGIQQLPVELPPTAAHTVTAGVENEGVDAVEILLAGGQIVGVCNADSFPKLDARTNVGVEGSAKVANDGRRFVAMHLYDIELKVHHPCDNALRHLVDKDANFFGGEV